MKKLLTLLAVVTALTGCREKTEWERRLERNLAIQETEEGKKFVTFRYRRALAYENKQEAFSPLDGIDEFEAWVLADEYRDCVYGICGSTRIPEFIDGKWKVLIAVGDPPPRVQPPLFIDAKTGRLQQAGYEPIEHPAEWLKNPRPPNQLPQPTPVNRRG